MTRTESISKFRKLFEQLSHSHDYSTTFSAFLDFALYRLAPYCGEQMKEDLVRLDKMFDPKLAPVICEMFECWSYACDNDGEGFYDALGDLFMDCVSFGRNGQFFTPQEVCDMMAEMTYGDGLEDGKSVNDPACGSGRMLLAMAKRNRRLKFYGADNDLTCVKMAALNMLVNSMKGEVAWMNTLSMEHYRSYHINMIPYGSHFIPTLTITGAGETYMIERMKTTYETKPNPTQSAPPETVPNTEDIIVNKKGQISLF